MGLKTEIPVTAGLVEASRSLTPQTKTLLDE
jgi:hypothetical protein